MRKKSIIVAIVILVVAAINAMIAVGVLSLATHGIVSFKFDVAAMMQHKDFMTLVGGIFAVELGVCLVKKMFDWSGSNTSLQKEKSNLENSQFLTASESGKIFAKKRFDKATDNGGILVGLEKNVAMLYPLQHTLLLGAQGTGKTVTYVSPQIDVVLRAKNKPSIIVTDIKGELLRLHGEAAKKQGYELKVLNLKDPLSSFRWNPLEDILQLKTKAMGASRKAEFAIKIAEEINEVVEGLFPVKNVEQSVWEESARDIIRAILYAMTEDFGSGKLIASQFNFVTVSDIVSQKGVDCVSLKKYFEFREMRSEARRLAMKALDAVVETRSGFVNALENYLAPFADKAISTLVSANEIDYAQMAKGNVAIFIEMSEIATTRHFIATAFLAKLYRELISIADKNISRGIKNNEVFYLLEEAGNLPAIPKLDKMLSAGRGRGVFVSLVIQSYSQLAKIYGDNVATTIRDNIDVEIFIGTSDLKTAEEFSRKCGNSSISSKSLSRNSSDSRMNINENVRERPLIYPTELMSLNNPPKVMGNGIVKIRGNKKPLRTKYTPYFKMWHAYGVYEMDECEGELANVPFFDIEKADETDNKTTKAEEKEDVEKENADEIRLSSTAKQILERYFDAFEIDELIACRDARRLVQMIDEIMGQCEKAEKIALTSAKKILTKGEKEK